MLNISCVKVNIYFQDEKKTKPVTLVTARIDTASLFDGT